MVALLLFLNPRYLYYEVLKGHRLNTTIVRRLPIQMLHRLPTGISQAMM